MKYTDQATLDFLSQLNQINKPITVIFYGDHLPGIYLKEEQNPDDSFLLHETDYFIWSNDASPSANVKLDDSEAAFSSSNYFMSSAAEHMNAKISPYLALLTKLHEEIPAISRVISNRGGIGLGTATYLQSDGTVTDSTSMSKTQKQLLADYKLVQYDQTSGKNYLKESDFMSVD
ncbi:MAG: sulfatase-like hydrolase/transferase [Bifidobacterium pseudocatenulatum]